MEIQFTFVWNWNNDYRNFTTYEFNKRNNLTRSKFDNNLYESKLHTL